MSVQLALLKSGEEVIADIKEFRDSKDDLVSYLFKDPHCIKINTDQLLICLLYTSPSPRDQRGSRMPSSA